MTLDPKWRVHTPNLLAEVLVNPGTSMLTVPMGIFARLLGEVAERASQLNDPELNALMMRLTLYDAADPQAKGYDAKLTQATIYPEIKA